MDASGSGDVNSEIFSHNYIISGFGFFVAKNDEAINNMERIGDHATNIAEWVLFALTSQRIFNKFSNIIIILKNINHDLVIYQICKNGMGELLRICKIYSSGFL